MLKLRRLSFSFFLPSKHNSDVPQHSRSVDSHLPSDPPRSASPSHPVYSEPESSPNAASLPSTRRKLVKKKRRQSQSDIDHWREPQLPSVSLEDDDDGVGARSSAAAPAAVAPQRRVPPPPIIDLPPAPSPVPHDQFVALAPGTTLEPPPPRGPLSVIMEQDERSVRSRSESVAWSTLHPADRELLMRPSAPSPPGSLREGGPSPAPAMFYPFPSPMPEGRFSIHEASPRGSLEARSDLDMNELDHNSSGPSHLVRDHVDYSQREHLAPSPPLLHSQSPATLAPPARLLRPHPFLEGLAGERMGGRGRIMRKPVPVDVDVPVDVEEEDEMEDNNHDVVVQQSALPQADEDYTLIAVDAEPDTQNYTSQGETQGETQEQFHAVDADSSTIPEQEPYSAERATRWQALPPLPDTPSQAESSLYHSAAEAVPTAEDDTNDIQEELSPAEKTVQDRRSPSDVPLPVTPEEVDAQIDTTPPPPPLAAQIDYPLVAAGDAMNHVDIGSQADIELVHPASLVPGGGPPPTRDESPALQDAQIDTPHPLAQTEYRLRVADDAIEHIDDASPADIEIVHPASLVPGGGNTRSVAPDESPALQLDETSHLSQALPPHPVHQIWAPQPIVPVLLASQHTTASPRRPPGLTPPHTPPIQAYPLPQDPESVPLPTSPITPSRFSLSPLPTPTLPTPSSPRRSLSLLSRANSLGRNVLRKRPPPAAQDPRFSMVLPHTASAAATSFNDGPAERDRRQDVGEPRRASQSVVASSHSWHGHGAPPELVDALRAEGERSQEHFSQYRPGQSQEAVAMPVEPVAGPPPPAPPAKRVTRKLSKKRKS